MKKYAIAILMFGAFEATAIALWLAKSNLFYLFNFSYIDWRYQAGYCCTRRTTAMRGAWYSC